MRRSLIAGLVLAVLAALAISVGGMLDSDLEHIALLGGAIGGALGLVPHPYSWGRIAAFLVGFVLAWIGFALRAAVIPDSANGRAVVAFLVVALCAAACAFSMNRLPLWAALLGVAAIVGAYEEIFTNAPAQFLNESPQAATTVLLAAGLGYLATSVIAEMVSDTPDERGSHRLGRDSGPASPAATPETPGEDLDRLNGLMAGEKK